MSEYKRKCPPGVCQVQAPKECICIEEIPSAQAGGSMGKTSNRAADADLRMTFHAIWTSHVGTEGYNKKLWQQLRQMLNERGIDV